MKESDNLAVILQSKMDKTAFSKLFTALDASGNEVDPSDDTKTIASIRANFGFGVSITYLLKECQREAVVQEGLPHYTNWLTFWLMTLRTVLKVLLPERHWYLTELIESGRCWS